MKVYFKPEQQCATENEFLEKHFGFGRFFPKLRTWKHKDVSMTAGFGNKLVESVLVLAISWKKRFWFSNENKWLCDMLELERNLVFTPISRQFAWELM